MSGTLLARSGALAGLDFAVGDSVRIGSAADADVRVQQPGVMPLHATITRDSDGVWLDDQSARAEGATCLNGRRVSRERLQHLDVITVGHGVDLIYLAP